MRIEIDEKNFELMLELDQIEKRIRLLGIQINVDFENRIPEFKLSTCMIQTRCVWCMRLKQIVALLQR